MKSKQNKPSHMKAKQEESNRIRVLHYKDGKLRFIWVDK